MTGPNTPHDADEPAVRSRFGALHARTYEMELLVSGAVVLGLLQLPPVVTAAFERYHAGVEGGARLIVGAVASYVLFVIYVLVGTFVLHLVMRAYWIGLLGLESVFGDGIRWQRLDAGPYSIRTLRRRLGTLAGAVDRTDDLCSLLFSFGFVIVSVFVYSMLVLGAAGLVSLAVSHLLLGGAHTTALFWAVVVAAVAPQLILGIVDKMVGPRLRPDGAAARLLERSIDATFPTSLMRWIGTPQATLQTNLSSTRVTLVIVGVCLALGLSHIAATLAESGRLRAASRWFFPVTLQGEGLDPHHYRDRRTPGEIDVRTPSIGSRVADGPYLELVVPYWPDRHNPLIRATCPDARPLRPAGVLMLRRDDPSPGSVRRAAACLGSLFAVRLDGEPVADPRWDFTIEEGSRLPAVVSFLPVRGLGPGRHELEVLLPGRDATAEDLDPDRHLIPFWR